MNKKIVLNWLPPASTDMPSPAMTVLKGALQKAGFNCKSYIGIFSLRIL